MSTRPPPLDGYENWIDWVFYRMDLKYGANENRDHARAELAELRAERDKYRTALENIQKHMEISGGGMTQVSSVYRIATKALEPQ